MRARWKALGVLFLVGAPHVTCTNQANDCGIQDVPNAKFVPIGGYCGAYCALACDDGFVDCDTNPDNGCETPTTRASAHELVESGDQGGGGCGEPGRVGTIGSCSIVCAPGWFDCDGDAGNGCERHGACSTYEASAPDALISGPQKLATLSSEPRGLASCAGDVVYFDADTLKSVDPASLAQTQLALSPALPSGEWPATTPGPIGRRSPTRTPGRRTERSSRWRSGRRPSTSWRAGSTRRGASPCATAASTS